MSKNTNLLVEARNLRNSLQKLRKILEKITNGGDVVEENESNKQENDNVSTDRPSTPKEETQIQVNKLHSSTVVIIGDIKGKGMYLADTLVRCGIKKLILFDSEDSLECLERQKDKWDSEENPNFELEAYVSSYEINENSFDHFIDRLFRGGDEETSVDLLIVPNLVKDSILYEIILKSILQVGCNLLTCMEDEFGRKEIILFQSTGQIVKVYENKPFGMIAIDILIGLNI